MADDFVYQSFKDIDVFVKANSGMAKYRHMLEELHKVDNFNLFFSKLKKKYYENKNDQSILNELKAAYNLKVICGFPVVFMPEKDPGTDLSKLKQGSYMILQMPDGIPTTDLARIKKPDLIIFFRGQHLYIEIKTINGRIYNVAQIIDKINESIAQIETFPNGRGIIQIFCEYVSDPLINEFPKFESEIINRLEKNRNIMGVLLTFYDLIYDRQLSENHRERKYQKRTKYLANENFDSSFLQK